VVVSVNQSHPGSTVIDKNRSVSINMNDYGVAVE